MAKDTHVLGIIFAFLGSFINSVGLLLQKRAYNRNALLPPQQRTIKWVAFGYFIYVCGNMCDLVALSLTAQTTVSGLAPLVLVGNVLFAPLIVGETVKRRHLVGTLTVCVGSLLMTLFGPGSFAQRKVQGCKQTAHLPPSCGWDQCNATESRWLASQTNESTTLGSDSIAARPQGNDFRVTDLPCLKDLFGEGAYISFMSFIAPVIFMNFAVVKWHERKWTRWEAFDEFDLALSGSLQRQNGVSEKIEGLDQDCSDSLKVSGALKSGEADIEVEHERESDSASHATTAATNKAVEELRPPALVIAPNVIDPETRESLQHRSSRDVGVTVMHRRSFSEPAGAHSDAVEVTAVAPSEQNPRRRCCGLRRPKEGLWVIDRECYSLDTSRGCWMGFSYACTTSLLSSFNIMASKIVGELVYTSAVDGKNQFDKFEAWIFVISLVVCNTTSIVLLSLSLSKFDALFIVPCFQVVFTVFCIISGGIYFNEFYFFSFYQWPLFGFGMLSGLAGVVILSRADVEATEEVQMKTEATDGVAAQELVRAVEELEVGGQKALARGESQVVPVLKLNADNSAASFESAVESRPTSECDTRGSPKMDELARTTPPSALAHTAAIRKISSPRLDPGMVRTVSFSTKGPEISSSHAVLTRRRSVSRVQFSIGFSVSAFGLRPRAVPVRDRFAALRAGMRTRLSAVIERVTPRTSTRQRADSWDAGTPSRPTRLRRGQSGANSPRSPRTEAQPFSPRNWDV